MHFISLTIGFIYRNLIKPILFKINPETVHDYLTLLGQLLGNSGVVKKILSNSLCYKNPVLIQEIAGMKFENPIGLAAGFDYEARLTQILASIGFGFETIGTITNQSYEGNIRPMLGRLPKSKSLMVNKGFKNLGAEKTIQKLKRYSYNFQLGVSIGRTNKKDLVTQKQSIEDIASAFLAFERSRTKHSYYELNISCPNLMGDVSFYPPKNLEDLLGRIDRLHLSRPLFIKMPIEKNDNETLQMLNVIVEHNVTGVVFGNLQKNRNNKMLDPEEVRKFPVGNFSGKPTFERSNELIKLTYKKYSKKLIIIGCGGVFSAEDAYKKIKLGASLVQLITGIIYQGPQLVSEINYKLVDLLKKDGYTNISQAVGANNK